MKKRFAFIFLLPFLLLAFSADKGLSGKWEYSGGIYNGKPELASKDYQLQRQYDDAHYIAYFIEKGAAPLAYEKGDYLLQQDTCSETQTFSTQPSKLLNVTLKYHYQLKHDTLTLMGVLPNGTTVQEYWKKVR